jgi:adenylate kinase family enzyme
MSTVLLDNPLGCHINVQGNDGKTTLAKAISSKQGIPFIELDDIDWQPGLVERDQEEFRERTTQAMHDAGSCWVVDGNYRSKLGDLVSRQADMIIYLNFP